MNKNIYLIPLFLILLTTTALAATLTATVSPSTAEPNSNLKLTVKTSGVPDGKWAVTYDVKISGGCTRSGKTVISGFTLNDVGEDKSDDYTITAPASDATCKFDVTYEFTEDTAKATSATATIKTSEPTATPVSEPTPTPKPVEIEPTGGNVGWIVVVAVVIIGLVVFFLMKKKKA